MASSRTGETVDRPSPLEALWMYFPDLSPRWSVRTSTGVWAASPMVLIPRVRRRAAVLPPHPYRSPMGRGQSFAGTSSGNRVWVLSGFSKSLAILARSLLPEIPTFTVKPRVSLILSRICAARACAASLLLRARPLPVSLRAAAVPSIIASTRSVASM